MTSIQFEIRYQLSKCPCFSVGEKKNWNAIFFLFTFASKQTLNCCKCAEEKVCGSFSFWTIYKRKHHHFTMWWDFPGHHTHIVFPCRNPIHSTQWQLFQHDEKGNVIKPVFCVCDWQRDDTLSAGRSLYVNYSGILQQFVQAYISKQQVFTLHN